MNKKAQAIFAGIMIFVMAFIVIVQLITPIKDQISTARNGSNLNCTNNPDITVGESATCVVTDMTLFYFVGMGIAAAAGFLGARFVRRKDE